MPGTSQEIIYPSPFPPVHPSPLPLFPYLLSLPIPPTRPTYSCFTTHKSYTRQQVLDSAKSLAVGLQKRGVKRGEVALIFSKTCVDYGVVALGCIAAGVVPSLASAAASPSELLYQLSDSSATLLFVHPDLLPTLQETYKFLSELPPSSLNSSATSASTSTNPSTGYSGPLSTPSGQKSNTYLISPMPTTPTPYPCFRSLLTPNKPAAFSPPNINTNDTAILCYSSGTTGLPKGVELSHKNLTSVLEQFGGSMPRPMYHIYGFVKQVLMSMHQGYNVICLPKFSVVDFCKCVQEYKCTFALAAPPVLLGLSNSPEPDKYDLSSLKWIMTGAAPCGEDLTLKVEKKFKKYGTLVVQGYGATETAPATAILNLDYATSHRGHVGQLCGGMEGRLVDEEERDCVKGGPGELWVRGPNIMKGYLNKPDATRNAITPSGWYKTGDVCTIDSQGVLKIVDRRKELIKVRGFQVAPAEMEGILVGHPEVADAGLVGVWDESKATELPRAYIVPSKGLEHWKDPKKAKQLIDDINAWLKPKVAHYKQLTGGIVFTDELPRLPSGKILRRVLKERAKQETAGVKAKM